MGDKNASRVIPYIVHTPFLRNFLLISLAVAIIFPIYSLWIILPSFTQQLTENTEDEAVRTASYLENHIIGKNTQLDGDLFSEKLVEDIGTIKEAFELEKLKIFSKDGRIVFSTTPEDIGEKNTNDYFYETVAGGSVYTKVIQKDAETSEGRVVAADVVETYVPIFYKGAFNGAFEIYYDITARKHRLDRLLAVNHAVLFAITSILMLAVVSALFKAGKSILAREKMEGALRNAHADLENKVRERTADLEKSNQELLNEINERKRAQESLQESEEKFRSISDTAQDAVIMMDDRGEVTYWNPAAERIFQFKSHEILHEDLHEVLAPKRHVESFRKYFPGFVRTGRGDAIGKKLELMAKRKDGREFPVEMSLSAVKIEGAWNAIGIVRDISAKRKAEKEKRDLERQLSHARKLESIGNLAGGIAHDFNNILSSILGYTELALDESEAGSNLADNLQEVYAGGKRARDLVRQILAFARQSDEEIKPVQPGAIAKEVIRFVRSSFPSTVEIQHKIETDSLVMGNATQIHQIFMNLFTNAGHAMKDRGGILTVSMNDVVVRDGSRSEKRLNLKPGDYIEIIVSDTGVGIAQGIVHSIFDPYFTTKGPGEGTGMGLAVVHGIVQSYGGRIGVNSVSGKGSTFTVHLPITRKRRIQGIYQSRPLPTGTESILLVDDEATIAKLGSRMLAGLGYSVTMRTSSVEALELFRERKAYFDLVITDLTMPNMTGDVLAAEIWTIRPDIPVILCTGYSSKIPEANMSQKGISAVAYKPLVKSELAGLVRKALDEDKAPKTS